MNAIGRERGWSPMTRQSFDALRSPRGALVVGSPHEVVEKILFQHEIFGHDRFLAQVSVGTLPHANVLGAIELLGTEVAPAVRAEIALGMRVRSMRAAGARSPAATLEAHWTNTTAPDRAIPIRSWQEERTNGE